MGPADSLVIPLKFRGRFVFCQIANLKTQRFCLPVLFRFYRKCDSLSGGDALPEADQRK